MSVPLREKQPDDLLDYPIDAAEWLASGDEVQSITVEADDGITVDSSSHTTDLAVVWLKGGEDGKTYDVSVEITTKQGRVKEFDFQLRVRERP